MQVVCVTGATGFVGAALVSELACKGFRTKACVRRIEGSMPNSVETMLVDDLNSSSDWSFA